MRIFWLIFAVLVLTYAAVYKIQTIGTHIPNRIGPEKVNLSVKTQITDSVTLSKAWTSNSGSTLFFYIFPEILNRTSSIGNEYATAVKIGSKQSLKILVSPDAGRGMAIAPAILEVYVNGSSQPEIIDIPNIALQRWSCVVILKQGRKFTIYINGKLSTSHTCTAMPDYDSSQTLMVGDPILGGSIALMCLDPYVLTSSEIASLVSDTMNGDGRPHLVSDTDTFTIPMFDLSFLLCPGGNCTTPKQIGQLEEWKTEYE
jgi:hypothetical protein